MVVFKVQSPQGVTQYLTGVVNLTPRGTVDHAITTSGGRDSGIILTTPRQLSADDWYRSFIRNKEAAMLRGTSVYLDENAESVEMSFGSSDDGNTANRLRRGAYLATIQGFSGDPGTGDFCITGSKTLDVSVGPIADSPGIVKISLPAHHFRFNAYLRDLQVLLMRLYHCYNSLSGRLQVWAPEITPDGVAGISTMGRYLGTLVNYQAVVARWNSYAWSSSFTLEIVEAGERATIAVGYVNLDCNRSDVTYSVSLTPRPEEVGLDVVTALTIFDQGVDSSLTGDAIIDTEFIRNGNLVSGTGYEGPRPAVLENAEITTVISTEVGGLPAFGAEQYHRTLIAIAPASGVDRAYSVQSREDVLNTIPIDVTATWLIDGVEYIKQMRFNIVAVGYAEDEDEEEDTGNTEV